MKKKKKYQVGGNGDPLDPQNLLFGQVPSLGKSVQPNPMSYKQLPNGDIIDITTGQVIHKADPNQSAQNPLIGDTTSVTHKYGERNFSPTFQKINFGLQAATALGNIGQNWTNSRQEYQDYLKSIQPRENVNKDADGLNNIPVYYQNGGGPGDPKPIIVTNPKDPRLKAYNDSSFAYNHFKKLFNQGINTGEINDGNGKNIPIYSAADRQYLTRQQVIQSDYNKYKDRGLGLSIKDIEQEYNNADYLKGAVTDNATNYYKFKHKNDAGSYTLAEYKKPVQPVVYQKPQTNKPITVSNPNDPRLQKYNDSLTLYNLSTDLQKFAKNNPDFTEQGYIPEYQNKVAAEEKLRVSSLIKPIDSKPMNGRFVDFYKKPVQPVVYQKPQSTSDKRMTPEYWDDGKGNTWQDKYKDAKDYKTRPTIQAPPPKPVYPLQNPQNYQFHGNTAVTPAQQQTIPEPTGSPVYGPANALIGYTDDSGKFSPTLQRDHIAQANQADLDLLNNPDQMSAYLKTKGMKFQIGGMNMKPALLEAGEIYKTNQGDISKIPDQADTHNDASGGVQVNNAQRILEDTGDKRNDFDSKMLRIDPSTLFKLTGAKSTKSVTHSKAFELGGKVIDKTVKPINKALEKNVECLDYNDNDSFAKNSLDLNSNNLFNQPTKEQLFDNLFNHQEMTKQLYNIQPEGQFQNGGNNGITAYQGDRRFKGNASKYSTQQWNKFAQDLGFKGGNNRDFQTFLLNQNGEVPGSPDLQSTIINLHQKFGNPNTPPSPNSVYNWIDGRLGHRWDAAYDAFYKGQQPQDVPQIPNDYASGPDLPNPMQPQAPSSSVQPFNPNRQIDLTPSKPSEFNQPLRWYDVASPLAAGISALNRVPATYNGIDLKKPNVKYQNPLPTLQAGQSDFNAALQTLPQNGVGYANQANLFNKKYAFNNQVLGNYENINNQIWNGNEAQRNQIDNAQEQSNQQARAVFNDQQLGSMEAQRQQLLRSLNDLTTTAAQNAALNRNGNLMMKLFPNFNQEGSFNGNQYKFTNPVGNGNQFIPPPIVVKKKTKK